MSLTRPFERAAVAGQAATEGCALDTPLGERLLSLLDDARHLPVEDWPRRLAFPTLADVAPHLRFSPEGYARTLLAATADAEVLVMGWLPGQASPIHGASHGISVVLAGRGEEERCHISGDDRAQRAGIASVGSGDVLLERPGDVHRVRNPTEGLLATLHLYAPRLQAVRAYAEE